MRDLDKYVQGFDELNILIQESDLNEVEDLAETLLILAYKRGVEDTDDEIDYVYDTEKNLSAMDKAINKKTDGKTWRERVKEYAETSDLGGMTKVVETEYHRVYQEASMNVAKDYQRATGNALTKTWVTVKDNRVRATHEPLEGLTKALDERFYTIDGDSALYPGNFENAENVINCRCTLIFNK